MLSEYHSDQKVAPQTAMAWFVSHKPCFSQSRHHQIHAGLHSLSIKKWEELKTITFINPMLALVVSVLFGVFGIDRFLIGDTGKGLLKFITFGGFLIWAVVDWFLICEAAIRSNEAKFISFMTEPLWIRNIRKKDPELADLWEDWDTHSDTLLMRAKETYLQLGMHDKAREVDELIDRYKNR